MKKCLFSFILLFIMVSSCKTMKTATGNKQTFVSGNETVKETTTEPDFHDATTWILGYFDPERLTHWPYSTWYTKGFDEYQYNTDAINKLLEINKDDLTIKIVMGTWCPDSRREVPRFMKVLDIWHFPVSKVTFIGVDDAKRSPVGEYTGLNIVRVPTFIVFKNNIEAGRIIENPVTSLEQDLVNILTGMNNNK